MSEGYDFGEMAEAAVWVTRADLRCARCGRTFGVRMGPRLSSRMHLSYNCHLRESDCSQRKPADKEVHVTYDLDAEPELIAMARRPPRTAEE